MINTVEHTTRPTGIDDLPTEVLIEVFDPVNFKKRMPNDMLEMSKIARFGDDLDPFEDPNVISPNEETPS